ncbi:hypothetical protein [Corynebacterium cystitidis]|uniref:hypothetical protein n=1 Tax=Corynebacterium cystitidis TaxID=35757 RepID=UPI00211EABC2|nr:hypothetical protein [Corynebacterium cystitidis]
MRFYDDFDPANHPDFPEPRLNNLETLFPLHYLIEGARYFEQITIENYSALMETAKVDGHRAIADLAIYPGASSCTCNNFTRDHACGHVATVVIKCLSGNTLAPELAHLPTLTMSEQVHDPQSKRTKGDSESTEETRGSKKPWLTLDSSKEEYRATLDALGADQLREMLEVTLQDC